ncbi:hypothetical protein EDC04DRAFT_3099685 [Pisolithus marmoratus]|nr:hypothetical protein EDC04DRAFT_3099685 [Pisolithus marmoratus]
MSIIDQVKVDVVSPTHDSDNARQLGAVSRCFARHRSATPSWHDPSMQAPEMHTPQLTRKEAALVASGSMTNQLAVRIRWSCTAYRRTTHPFGAVKKNLACANTGLGAVTEWRDIVKIARHGTDSIMLNPVNVCIEHHVSQRLSAQHHPSTRVQTFKYHLTKQPQPLDNAPSGLSLVSKLYWIWRVAARIKKIDLATSNTKYYSRTELVEPHSPCPA